LCLLFGDPLHGSQLLEAREFYHFADSPVDWLFMICPFLILILQIKI